MLDVTPQTGGLVDGEKLDELWAKPVMVLLIPGDKEHGRPAIYEEIHSHELLIMCEVERCLT